MKSIPYILNKIQRLSHTTISNKIIQLQVFQCILYINLLVLIPPQNMFKVFLHISGIWNIAFSKADMGTLQIITKVVLFNLDRWLWIIMHHKTPLAIFDKDHKSDLKYCIHYIPIHHNNYSRKSLGKHWANVSRVPNYLFISLQWFVNLYGQEKLISIVRTHSYLSPEHIHKWPNN